MRKTPDRNELPMMVAPIRARAESGIAVKKLLSWPVEHDGLWEGLSPEADEPIDGFLREPLTSKRRECLQGTRHAMLRKRSRGSRERAIDHLNGVAEAVKRYERAEAGPIFLTE